jgi:SAM-dependent methyltransferase
MSYGVDLAYIHDTGYGDFARESGPGILALLRKAGLHQGCVVDLGCGSGIWARQLADAGYDVLGIDLSPAMIDMARQRVASAEFRVGSFVDAVLPRCVAVTALGEVLSYVLDESNTDRALLRLCRRVHDALVPGGLFVFDVVVPGRVPGGGPRQAFRSGEDWTVLVESSEDAKRRLLTRRIMSFRKVGEHYRRDEEVHRQRLHDRASLTRHLRALGFRVRPLASYGKRRFPRGVVGFLTRKHSARAT